MTKIFYSPETYRLEAVGHAGAGTKGNDLVCAGITTLMATAVAALEKKEIRTQVVAEEDTGEMEIRADPGIAQVVIARVILDTVAAGLEEMARAHPENVRVQRIVWGEE